LGAKIAKVASVGTTKTPSPHLWKELRLKPNHMNQGLTWLSKIRGVAVVQMLTGHGQPNIVPHVLNHNVNSSMATLRGPLQLMLKYALLLSQLYAHSTTDIRILFSKVHLFGESNIRESPSSKFSCRKVTIVMQTLL
jgi:hypothetical protein